MNLGALRRSVNTVALLIAAIVALFAPIGYWTIAYLDEAAQLQFKAQLSASRLSKYIYANEKMWQYQKVRLHEIIEFNEISDDVRQRVIDTAGKPVVTAGRDPGRYTLQRNAKIVVAGRHLATLQATQSLVPLMWNLAAVSTVSLALALSAYFSVRILPLRALDRSLSALEAAKNDLLHKNAVLTSQAAQLSEAQRLGRIGYWQHRLSEQDVRWSPEVFELLGYDPSAFRPTRKAVLDLCSEEDQQKVLASTARVLRSDAVDSIDVKVRLGNGAFADISHTARTLKDDNGNVVGLTGTIQDISARKRAEAQLERLAYYDPLTGLPNRSLFNRALTTALNTDKAAEGLSALLLLDLDRFKEVNDTLGHAAGDELLMEVVRRINQVLPRDDFFARLGGDEFAIIVNRFTTRMAIEGAAARVLAAVSGQVQLERGEVTVGVSLGIAICGRDGLTTSDLLRNADLALYQAKEHGRGRLAFFEPQMNAVMQNKLQLARDLRHSLATDTGLHIHYQPQIDLRTGKVVGYEALARWNHPERGNISPVEFIPIAESSHLICDLGNWILRNAAAQAKGWIDAGEPPREVAVNVSAAQIWHSDVVLEIETVLQDTGLPPHLLCIELTESLMAERNDVRVRGVLNALKQKGLTIALDDFGTGYSSLGYLAELPFDKLKIDRVFVAKIATSEHARQLLKGIIALGHSLQLQVQAEGAEQVEEVRALLEFGCDYVQGFAFARPCPADDALAFARAYEGHNGAQTLLSAIEDAHEQAA